MQYTAPSIAYPMRASKWLSWWWRVSDVKFDGTLAFHHGIWTCGDADGKIGTLFDFQSGVLLRFLPSPKNQQMLTPHWLWVQRHNHSDASLLLWHSLRCALFARHVTV
jgi:hypothetical protein